MAVEVRIKNFQSIEDATLVVDGLTVITGINNSGKTAAIRAIKGVFTNPPAGALVRHGCAYLSVTLVFDDGTTVTWEKGWEKPNQKGKTINRYLLNGKELAGVGSGVPPEVEDLGVKEVRAASDRIWPQIADQFDGSLFLVNRPGSATAEALSDVERVGSLTAALKASEKDKRSVDSELKIRRKDVQEQTEELSKYDGLGEVGELVEDLSLMDTTIKSKESEISKLEGLKSSYDDSRTSHDLYSDFDTEIVPDPTRVQRLGKAVRKVTGLSSRLESSTKDLDRFEGFVSVSLPDPSGLQTLSDSIASVQGFASKLGDTEALLSSLVGCEVEIPDSGEVERLSESLTMVSGFVESLGALQREIQTLGESLTLCLSEFEDSESEVSSILGEMGMCPVCNTVHSNTGASV
jgi:hypothetical protein